MATANRGYNYIPEGEADIVEATNRRLDEIDDDVESVSVSISGATGSFTTADSKTVTVTNGLIVSIV